MLPRHPTVPLQQKETTERRTALSTPSRDRQRNGVEKQSKSSAARTMSAPRQEDKLSTGSPNTPTPGWGPDPALNCSDPAGGTPPPAPAPQRPLREDDRQAQVKGPPGRPPTRSLVWRPSKAKDNYYERAVLTKADHLKLKTTTTLEWGLHGPQARKTVFILQTHSGRPPSSLNRAASAISGLGGCSRPSSTRSCVGTDLSHLQGPDDTIHCDTVTDPPHQLYG